MVVSGRRINLVPYYLILARVEVQVNMLQLNNFFAGLVYKHGMDGLIRLSDRKQGWEGIGLEKGNSGEETEARTEGVSSSVRVRAQVDGGG